MAQLNFKKLVFKNFMSYGNTVNTFTFPKGMIWFSADNGYGKSSVVEALNFALFGVSYRGGNKGDLRNTKNTECDMEVSLEFDARTTEKDPWVPFRVSRIMKPSGTIKFDIFKEEDGKWVAQNKRTGYGQKDFEADILGFNEILFKASIAQNTQETKPFMEMGVPDRRKLTESIILLPTDQIKKGNSKKLSDAKLEFDVQTAEYQRLGNEIENTQKLIQQMKVERIAAVNAKTEEKNRFIAKIGEDQSRLSELSTLIQKNRDDAAKFDPIIQQICTELNGCMSKLSEEPSVKAKLASFEQAEKTLGVLDEYKKAVDDAKLKYDAIVADGSQYDIAGWNTFVKEATGKQASMTDTINQMSLDIRTAETNAAHASTQMNDIKVRGCSMEVQPSAFKVGEPCPTCGKLYTADDIDAHMRAEQARIEKLKGELRNQWLSAKDTRDKQQAEAERIKVERDQIFKLRDEIVSQVEDVNRKISDYHINYESKLAAANGVYKQASGKYNDCLNQLKSIGVPAEQLSSEIAGLKKRLEEFDTVRHVRDELLERKQAKEAEKQAVLDKGKPSEQEFLMLSTEVSGLNGNVARLDDEIAKLNATGGTDALAMAEARLESAGKERETAFDRIQNADDTIRICECISNMVSDNGMKKMVFDIFIPQFNRSVQKNLRRANLPFTITFDSTMDYKYSAGPGLAPTFDMLSQGQKRKVGFAISLAFRDFVNMVGNFKVNFLSLDEVLDISTDNNAMRDMLDLVKTMVDEIGCISVITHRGDVVADKFDYKLTITNNGAYSRLGKLEKI